MSQTHCTIKTETLASVTAGSATNDTFYYYIDMQTPVNFRKAGIQFEWTAGGTGTVTVTVEGTIQDDRTAADSCTYQDITNGTFGVASWTDDFIAIDCLERLSCYRYVRVKVVTLTVDTTAVTGTAWSIFSKQVA